MVVTAPSAVDTARSTIQPALRAAVELLPPGIQRLVGYHFGWLDRDGNPHDGGVGKALRPTLALLGARAAGFDERAAVPAAVAVELVHNSSLLHDDLIDGDRTRHHRPTVWSVFGMPSAVLAGDALLNLAYHVIGAEPAGSYDASRWLAEATNRMLAGQAADISFEHRLDVTVEESLAMAEDKTAALLSGAAAIGSAYVGGPAEITSALAAYGRHLGVAFQLVDDVLGIWGAAESTGKPVLADLRVRKKSLPVVYALRAGDAASAELAELYAAADLTEADLRRCADLVVGAGGRDWAEREAAAALDRALAAVRAVPLPTGTREELDQVAAYVTARNR